MKRSGEKKIEDTDDVERRAGILLINVSYRGDGGVSWCSEEDVRRVGTRVCSGGLLLDCRCRRDGGVLGCSEEGTCRVGIQGL